MACSHGIGGEKPIALARDTVQGTARTGGKDLLFEAWRVGSPYRGPHPKLRVPTGSGVRSAQLGY